MHFKVYYDVGDRVVDDSRNRAGRIDDTDLFAADSEWYLVLWDGDQHPTWSGKGENLRPEKVLPAPPKFTSIEEADAWLAKHS